MPETSRIGCQGTFVDVVITGRRKVWILFLLVSIMITAPHILEFPLSFDLLYKSVFYVDFCIGEETKVI